MGNPDSKMLHYSDVENDSSEPSGGEKLKEAKYPEICPNPDCNADNSSQASSCFNCEMKFDPVVSEDENTLDEESL